MRTVAIRRGGFEEDASSIVVASAAKQSRLPRAGLDCFAALAMTGWLDARVIAGVDEAGRGPLAGPVVAAAVILCAGGIEGLDDSKKLSAKRRAVLEAEIFARCTVGIGEASVEEIDRINILQATMLAMTRAVEALAVTPEHVLVDGNRLPTWHYRAEAVIGGDAIHPCISAASIVAKEHRDRIMFAADFDFPGYGWASNKGYGAAAHLAALERLGVTPLHRKSFAPVARLICL